MYENKERYLTPMTLTAEIYKTTLSNLFNNITSLEYDEDLVRLNETKEQRELKKLLIKFYPNVEIFSNQK